MKRLKWAAILAAMAGLFAPSVSAQEMMYGDTQTKIRHTEWSKNAVVYEVNLRQGTKGRTFESFRKELPRLKELGVDILWLMPIHPISKENRKGELGSYYAVADYKAINPEFGNINDFRRLVKTAHDLGMKVILDEVCNHTGCDHPWTRTNPEFYVRENGKFTSPYDWTDTYKLDYSNKMLRRQMLDALKFWVKELDIDGYRCDVAGEVPTDFWEEARRELNKIKPVFMLAEASKPELLVSAFDSDYNWPMKDLFNAIAATKGINKYAIDKKQQLPAKTALSIDTLLMRQRNQYPRGGMNLNMITNHDLNSWEGTEFDRYTVGVEAFAVLSYTLPGIPMMYMGQEVGFDHAWEFFKHDICPDYTPNNWTAFYTKLNALKQANPALNAGVAEQLWARHATKAEDIYAFTRIFKDRAVTVIVNLSNETLPVEFLNAPKIDGMIDYFARSRAQLPTELKPWEYRIFVK